MELVPRFIIVDDDQEDRERITQKIKNHYVDADILEASHPYFLKKRIEEARDTGVSFAKPSIVFMDGSMELPIPCSDYGQTDWEINYKKSHSEFDAKKGSRAQKKLAQEVTGLNHSSGGYKVLSDMAEYIGDFISVNISGAIDTEPTKMLKSRSKVEAFLNNPGMHSIAKNKHDWDGEDLPEIVGYLNQLIRSKNDSD